MRMPLLEHFVSSTLVIIRAFHMVEGDHGDNHGRYSVGNLPLTNYTSGAAIC